MSPDAEYKFYSIFEASESSSSLTAHSPTQAAVDDENYDFGRRPSDFELHHLFHDEEPLLPQDSEDVLEKGHGTEPVLKSSSSTLKSAFWVLVNVVATVLIVYLFPSSPLISIILTLLTGLYKQSHSLRKFAQVSTTLVCCLSLCRHRTSSIYSL
jgi:hypothetical protein